MTPACRIVLREAPKAQYGPVTSSPTTIGQFWYSIGLALSTILLDRMTVGGVTDKLLAAGVQPDLVGTAVTAINQYVSAGTPPSTALARQALADASATYASAFSTVMLITAGLVLAAGVSAWSCSGVPVLGSTRGRLEAQAPAATLPTLVGAAGRSLVNMSRARG